MNLRSSGRPRYFRFAEEALLVFCVLQFLIWRLFLVEGLIEWLNFLNLNGRTLNLANVFEGSSKQTRFRLQFIWEVSESRLLTILLILSLINSPEIRFLKLVDFRLYRLGHLYLRNQNLGIRELGQIYRGVFHQGRSDRSLERHIQVNFGLVERSDFGVAHLEADLVV